MDPQQTNQDLPTIVPKISPKPFEESIVFPHISMLKLDILSHTYLLQPWQLDKQI